MKRKNTFTVDASGVQGIEGATITSKAVKQGNWKLYGSDVDHGDAWFVETHVIAWEKVVDDEGHELPSPADEPGIVGELYMHEIGRIARLIAQGPDGPDALKN
jgi:beta-lactamase superfamily II metal-dependent hydrolase